MNILAMDTATGILSAALKTDKGLYYIEADAGLHHSEMLLDLCNTLAEMAGMGRKDLDLVACMKGPGSFTGLRIGFAAAKGMAAALGIPFISIPSLDCMAYTYTDWPLYILPVIDAKKNHFFTALYYGAERVRDYADTGIPQIMEFLPRDKQVLVTGPDTELFFSRIARDSPKLELVRDTQKTGKARELLVLAEKWYIINGKGDELSSGPMYLRKSDAELSLEKQDTGVSGHSHGI